MWIEIAGTVLSLAYLYLSVRQKPALWIFGFLCSALYTVVFFRSKFYADMTLQLYYLAVSVYGWWNWQQGTTPSKQKDTLPVTVTPRRLWPALAIASILIFMAYYAVLRRTDAALPAGDSFTTALSIVATWMLAKKYIEYWLIFIVVDALSAGQYIYKELYPTAALFVVYTIMAVVGYFQWKKSLETNNEPLG